MGSLPCMEGHSESALLPKTLPPPTPLSKAHLSSLNPAKLGEKELTSSCLLTLIKGKMSADCLDSLWAILHFVVEKYIDYGKNKFYIWSEINLLVIELVFSSDHRMMK